MSVFLKVPDREVKNPVFIRVLRFPCILIIYSLILSLSHFRPDTCFHTARRAPRRCATSHSIPLTS